MAAHMLMLNAIEQADPRCFCLLDTGANALVLPRRDDMLGTEAQCTVPGGNVVPGTVVQTLHYNEDDCHVVAIDGASPLMPLSWLVLLAGWSYVPVVKEGRLEVTIVSPRGMSVALVERSKMHYIDKATFFNILRDAWTRCKASDGMGYDQLEKVLTAKEYAPCGQFLGRGKGIFDSLPGHEYEQKGLPGYMRRIVDLQRTIETMNWPSQNYRPGIAGGSTWVVLGSSD